MFGREQIWLSLWYFFRAFTRRIVGLIWLVFVGLTYIALWDDSDHAPWMKQAVDEISGHTIQQALQPETHGSPTISGVRSVWILYALLVHVAALVFPIRACWAIRSLTKQIRTANVKRLPPPPHIPTSDNLELGGNGLLEPPTSYVENDRSPTPSTYDGDDELPFEAVVHAILLPNYKEDVDSLRETLDVLACHVEARARYDIFLAMEQGEVDAVSKAQALCSEYRSSFRNIIYTVHPQGLPGEAQGKSSNLSWAAKEARQIYSTSQSRTFCQNVVVTVMDCDSHLSATYFSSIQAMHTSFPVTRETTIYVAPIVFDRNAHAVPRLVRAADLLWCGAGLSGLHQNAVIRPPTSVYSLPLSLVEQVDGWDAGPDAIGEDLHMYIKCFFSTGGRLTCRTVPSAASQSNVHTDLKGIRGYVAAHQARYKQALRHMWGSLDTGYAVRRTAELWWRAYVSDKDEPCWEQSFRLTSEGNLSHASSSKSAAPGRPKPHWLNILMLYHRLFEAHFLPVHLVTIILATALYDFFHPSGPTAVGSPTPEALAQANTAMAYLRLAGFALMLLYLHLHESYHALCLSLRSDAMHAAGLHDNLEPWFSARKGLLGRALDYAAFPVAGMLYGTVPAVQAMVGHLVFGVRLGYVSSGKPEAGGRERGTGPRGEASAKIV